MSIGTTWSSPRFCAPPPSQGVPGLAERKRWGVKRRGGAFTRQAEKPGGSVLRYSGSLLSLFVVVESLPLDKETPCGVWLGEWLGSRSCCTGARLTFRLTPSVDRRTRLAAPTSTRTRTRARAARHISSLQRIVSGSTGCVLPARCSLHMLHSLE